MTVGVGWAPLPSFTPTSPRFLCNPLIDELSGQDLAPAVVCYSNTTNNSTTTTATPTAIALTSNTNALPIAEMNVETLDLTSNTPPLIDVTSTAKQAQVTNMAHFFDDTVIAMPSQVPQGWAGAIAEPQIAVQSPPSSTTSASVPCQACTPNGSPSSCCPMILDYFPLVL
jgi:hypothetical protein